MGEALSCGQRLRDFPGVAGIAVDVLADNLQRHLLKVDLQIGIEISKFRPKHLSPRHLDIHAPGCELPLG